MIPFGCVLTILDACVLLFLILGRPSLTSGEPNSCNFRVLPSRPRRHDRYRSTIEFRVSQFVEYPVYWKNAMVHRQTCYAKWTRLNWQTSHRRRLLPFSLSQSSRSAFSACFSSAISRFLLSSYAFACLISSGVRLPVGFWRVSNLL